LEIGVKLKMLVPLDARQLLQIMLLDQIMETPLGVKQTYPKDNHLLLEILAHAFLDMFHIHTQH
jgi:hypothetical protein